MNVFHQNYLSFIDFVNILCKIKERNLANVMQRVTINSMYTIVKYL